MVVKVKEPQLAECKMLRAGQILFTYLHLAADAEQAQGADGFGLAAIAYETVTASDGSLPLLTPMSEVAGRMSRAGRRDVAAEGERRHRRAARRRAGRAAGEGRRFSAAVSSGTNAAQIAVGMRAEVTVVDHRCARCASWTTMFGGELKTAVFDRSKRSSARDARPISSSARCSSPAPRAPKLVTRDMVATMKPGA